jgi:hypothetical protein
VALVVTLMMMSVLVMMVVGLAGVMRNEQAAARNLTYQVLAEQMAELGAREAMGVILSNSTGSIGRPSATGPGWMMTNGVFVPLFSSNAAGQLKNLEEIGTNSLILSLPDGVRGRVMAAWTNVVPPGEIATRPIGRYAWWVDDEGTKADLNAVGSNNSLYLPLLTNFPLGADRLFVSDPVTGATNQATADWAQGLRTRTNAIFTPESIKDTNLIRVTGTNATNPLVYRRAKGHLTTWSSHTDLTPWGTAKFNLADLTNTTLYPTATSAVAALKTALMTNALTNVFGADANLGKKYGGGAATATNTGNHGDLVMEQIAANILATMGRPVILTNASARGGDFHPVNADTNLLRHRSRMPTKTASHYVGPYLEQVRARVDYIIQTNATSPTTPKISGRLGIWVRVVNPHTNTFANWSLRIQPRKWKFVVKPDPQQGAAASVFGNASAAGITYGAPIAGFASPPDQGFNIVAGPAWEVPSQTYGKSWPLGATFDTNSLTFGPKNSADFFFTNVISFTLANAQNNEVPVTVSEAYVMLDQVLLYEGANPGNSAGLRDWLTHDDLAQEGNFRLPAFQDYGQFSFDRNLGANNPVPQLISGTTFPFLSTNLFSSAVSHGVRKVDPQVRFHVSVFANITQPSDAGLLRPNGWPSTATGPRAWTTNSTFNCTNTNGTVTGLPDLWPDPAPGVTDVLNHPHFEPGYRPMNGIKSVAQLGAIHTGIPWRTLRLQPTPAAELAQGPPDWVVLEMFTATNATNPRTMVNLNAVPLAFGGTATNANGSISTRAWSVAAAMGPAGTNLPSSATNQAASNGVPVSLAQAFGGYSNLAALASNLTVALTNPTDARSWSGNSGWGNYRSTQKIVSFPSNGLLFKGELLEMPGVADDPARYDDVIEGRLRAYLDLVTTRSDVFTVWSAGQGLVVNTNLGNRTNVMGEVRKQTVFQRVPMFNAAGTQVTNYQVRLLYTRNHVVE